MQAGRYAAVFCEYPKHTLCCALLVKYSMLISCAITVHQQMYGYITGNIGEHNVK